MNRRRFSSLMLGAYCSGIRAMTADNASCVPVEYVSSRTFSATLDRVIQAIEAAGMRIFARIDHAAGAREVGLAMPTTMLLIYGHPKGGTPIMLASPQAGLELPLRVLVREDADARTRISFHPIVPLLREVGVPQELAQRLEPAQRVLLEALQP